MVSHPAETMKRPKRYAATGDEARLTPGGHIIMLLTPVGVMLSGLRSKSIMVLIMFVPICLTPQQDSLARA